MVTFTAYDECGNKATTAARITIEDTTPPQIVTEASDKTVECDGNGNVDELTAWLESNGGTAVANDICRDVTIWSNNFEMLSDDCGATGSTTVMFTATDECGNSSSTTATFTIEDTHRDEKVYGKTCVPAGTYNVKLRNEGGMTKRYARRYKTHQGMIWLQDVPGFEWVYVHVGNDAKASDGCILVNDGVISSTGAIRGRCSGLCVL